MKLNDKYYYCFGCHAHGDAVSLAAQVLNLPQKDAAVRLADAFHIDIHDCCRPGRKIRGHVKPHRPDLKSLAEKLAVIQQTALIRKRQEWLDHAMQILGRYTQLINDWRIRLPRLWLTKIGTRCSWKLVYRKRGSGICRSCWTIP